jgi:hypothetical protein
VVRLPAFDPIEYLVSRRYPTWKVALPSFHTLSEAESIGRRRQSREKALAYEQELRGKTPAEIADLVKAERATEAEEHRRKQEAEENARYFNQPSAMADVSHWGKLSYWTLDEALALSFGRAPESVSWKLIEAYTNVSPFAFLYKRRRELALRAKASSELYDPVRPSFFIAWAKRLDWEISTDLEAVVVSRGQQIGDWKTAYENEKDAHAKTMEWAKSKLDDAMEFAERQQAKAFEIGRRTVAERDAEIARLQEALRTVEKQKNVDYLDTAKTLLPDLGPRERESMLRLIVGMAIRGYSYDPAASRNAAVKEIADDLQFLGIGLDEDTVRKYLSEGRELLPRGETE